MSHRYFHFFQATHLSCIESRREVRVYEENVLRLEICVRQLLLVKELDCITKLVADVPDVVHWIRLIVVVLQKVEHT